MYSLPRKTYLEPALRGEPKSKRLSIGKSRSANTRKNSWPTAPLAPTIATFIMRKYSRPFTHSLYMVSGDSQIRTNAPIPQPMSRSEISKQLQRLRETDDTFEMVENSCRQNCKKSLKQPPSQPPRRVKKRGIRLAHQPKIKRLGITWMI